MKCLSTKVETSAPGFSRRDTSVAIEDSEEGVCLIAQFWLDNMRIFHVDPPP